MDYAYDLLDKIQEDKTDYLLITLRKGRQQYKVDVFYAIQDEEGSEALLEVLNEVAKSIKEGESERRPPKEGDEDHEDGYEDGYEDEDEEGDEQDFI